MANERPAGTHPRTRHTKRNLVPFLTTMTLAITSGSCEDLDRAGPIPVSPAPYPPSPVIAGITFDWSTHDRRAPGSDNWPITWADDGHQYTSWGDGGGFGGDTSDGRVSLGVARIAGDASSFTGRNVWGGKNAENTATFGGKSYGVISVDGVLYMWVRNAENGSKSQLAWSDDHALTWTWSSWMAA